MRRARPTTSRSNGDGDNSEATFTGTLGGSVGLDTPGHFSFAALDGTTGTVGTETVNYSWAANTLTATGPRGVLFTVRGHRSRRPAPTR